MQLCFFPRFTVGDRVHAWMLIKGYNNHLCGETPTDQRMRVPALTTNFADLSVTLTDAQRKPTISASHPSGQDARKQEDWLKM
jgi:hypothetical protein